MGDITHLGVQRTSEKTDWMVAVQNVRCHPNNCIAGSSPQVPELRFAQSVDGVSGHTTVVIKSNKYGRFAK